MIFICWTILRKMAEKWGRHASYFGHDHLFGEATSLGEFVIPLKGWQFALCNAFIKNAEGANVNFHCTL